MDRKFDSKVQLLKYNVIKEVARAAWEDNLLEKVTDIPKIIVPKDVPTMRCCVYKERAIVQERIKLAMGGNSENPNVIEVIDIACDECPTSGYEVTSTCRGCIAHHCESVCPRNAITFDENLKAHIDKDKCVNCGQCAKVCPYSAISNFIRPCESACQIKAISKGENNAAHIDNDKCISCGACSYKCPFGAIGEKSYVLEAIKMLKSDSDVYAVIAPAIASQFTYAKLGQVLTGIKKLGFSHIIEAALGADMVAYKEAKELAEKGFLTSSCCPAFVSYTEKAFPKLKDSISTNLSPMATVSKEIKISHPDAKVVFIGPCTAKKMEVQKEEVKKYVDCVITFQELQALFDSKDIDITTLEETELDTATFYGRIFARCGGLAEAVDEALDELGYEDFELKAISSNGIGECRTNLLKASKGLLDKNFIEGMACLGGCIGGAGCLTHMETHKIRIDNYAKTAKAEKIVKNVESKDIEI